MAREAMSVIVLIVRFVAIVCVNLLHTRLDELPLCDLFILGVLKPPHVTHVDCKHVLSYLKQTIMKTNKNDGRVAKRRENNDGNTNVNTKKPFDKKKYRLQKYSNKYKVAQWEERRKKAVLRGFYKDLHKEQQNNAPDKQPLNSESPEVKPEENSSNPKKKKKSAFFAAKQEFQKKKTEQLEKKQRLLKSKAERDEALSNYKEKKMQMYKKLSKKTKKGQPVMKDRLEMLLEKIKESTSA